MAGSLKDQLMQAGLVSADRARKLEKEARAEKQAKRQGAAKGKAKGKGKQKGEAKAPEPTALTEAQQRAQLDVLREMNAKHQQLRPHEADLAARLESFELAYRMQSDAAGTIQSILGEMEKAASG